MKIGNAYDRYMKRLSSHCGFRVGAYFQARNSYLTRARNSSDTGMRKLWAGLARDSHHAYLREIGALK